MYAFQAHERGYPVLSLPVIIAMLHGPILVCPSGAHAQDTQGLYQQLPRPIRQHIDSVRKSCAELNDTFKVYNPMQGVMQIDLDGAPAVLVDDEELCANAMAGANCSNRGCDLAIWKLDRQKSWQKIFDKHLHRKFIVLDERRSLKLMAVSISASDPNCNPVPDGEYTSGQSCDALVYYRSGDWVWNVVQKPSPNTVSAPAAKQSGFDKAKIEKGEGGRGLDAWLELDGPRLALGMIGCRKDVGRFNVQFGLSVGRGGQAAPELKVLEGSERVQTIDLPVCLNGSCEKLRWRFLESGTGDGFFTGVRIESAKNVQSIRIVIPNETRKYEYRGDVNGILRKICS